MMKNVSVEIGSVRDIPAVMGVMDTAFDPEFGERWTENQCLSALSMSNYHLFVALSDGIIVGFALIRTIIDESELLMIGVHPNWQRMSIASSLLDKIILYCHQYNHRQIFLEVRSGNAAEQFYAKIGFYAIGNRPNYYCGPGGSRFDAITMSKKLID